jgi:hypothetical protein
MFSIAALILGHSLELGGIKSRWGALTKRSLNKEENICWKFNEWKLIVHHAEHGRARNYAILITGSFV